MSGAGAQEMFAHNQIEPIVDTNAEPENAKLLDMRFRALVGEEAWCNLPARTQARFTKRLSGGDSCVFRGEVNETRFSVAGFCLAQICRVIGAPLPLEKSDGQNAAVVTVTEEPTVQGQIWSRHYNRRNGFPQVIHSTKSFAGPTGLQECTEGGVGMSLILKAEDGVLKFLSHRYFFSVFGKQVILPRWVCPGRMLLQHEDKGEGEFVFTLSLVHPLLGELIYQRATFHDQKEA